MATAPCPEPQPSLEHIMQFFTYAHLPQHLQDVSRPFADMAERTVALRKLLEAKDAAVRALLAGETPPA